MEKEFQRCTKCVMDNLADDFITFDAEGVCNYYTDALAQMEAGAYLPNAEGQSKLNAILQEIKKDGQGKEYDCLMGVSGGLDSSYLLYLGAVKWGLRILAIHIDDGFDTQLAKENIEKLCKSCNVTLQTIAPDAEQFNDLTRAFFLSEVPNVAVPQDNILFACLFDFAKKHHVKHFLSGGNFALESILQKDRIPHNQYDMVNNRDIHRRFGTKPIDKLPFLSNWQRIWNAKILGIKTYRPLNYIDYNRNRAIEELGNFCGFQYYEAKHLENTLTKVIQLYWYYHKFNIDKRKSHLSSMILSGQMTREEALRELEKPIYDSVSMEKDLQQVLSKINLDRKEFDEIIGRHGKSPQDYKTDKLFKIANRIISAFVRDKKSLVK